MPTGKNPDTISGIYRDELGAVIDHSTIAVFPELSEHGPYPRSDLDFIRIANHLRG